MDLTISIICTNNKDLLKQCLNSIEKSKTGKYIYEIYVVDNCSKDNVSEMIESCFPDVKVITNKKCLGFSANHNKVIKKANGKYILLLNDDTIIEQNTLYNMIRFMDQNPNIGISGCKVFLSDGTVQKTCGNFPKFLGEFIRITIGLTFRSKISKNYIAWRSIGDFDYNSVRKVDWLSGVFMFIRSDLTKKVGLLDEKFFIYYEDVEYCFRTNSISDYEIVYNPYCNIKHLHGQTIKKVKYSDLVYNIKSCAYYFSKTKGTLWGKFIWYFSFFYYHLLYYTLMIFDISTFGRIKKIKIVKEKIALISKMLKST